MSTDTITLAKSYKTPWTLSTFNALPGNPVSIGVVFTIALLIVFFTGRALADGGATLGQAIFVWPLRRYS